MLVEATTDDSDTESWDVVLRGEYASRDAARETGRVRLGRPEEDAEPRRIVAVPLSYFKPQRARVKRTESLEWEDA